MKISSWLFKTADASYRDNKLPQNHTITTPSGLGNAFSKEECSKLLEVSLLGKERDALTGDGLKSQSNSHRTSKVRDIFPDESTNWIFERLEVILTEMNKQYQFDVQGFFEGAQIYQYPEGGYLDWHMDIAKGLMSTRKLSMTIQLTDGSEYEGGDLEFFDYGGHAAPRGIGALTVFPSYLQHRVTKVTKGNRYSWVSWVHGSPFK